MVKSEGNIHCSTKSELAKRAKKAEAFSGGGLSIRMGS